MKINSICNHNKMFFLNLLFLSCFVASAFSSDELPGIVNGIAIPQKTSVMVQLFNWRFTDIKKAIPQIRKIGYSHIQVSPPQKSNDDPSISYMWYARYQPVDYREISGPLGNEAEFIDMVNTANANGISIVVDAVINHLASGKIGGYWDSSGEGSNKRMISEKYPDFEIDDFHPYKEGGDPETLWFSDGDLPDLDTGKKEVQNKLAKYFSMLSNIGVGGFRIDAARHIGPKDLKAILSDVAKDKMIICEIIPDDSDRDVYRRYNRDIQGVDYYDFPLLLQVIRAFSFGGDLNSLDNNLEYGIDGSDSVTFITNHDIDRGRITLLREGLWGSGAAKWRINREDYYLAYAYIMGRRDGLPCVFADMANPKAVYDDIPDERFDAAEIVSGIRFHNLAIGKDQIKCHKINGEPDNKNIVVYQRGDDQLFVINKGTETANLADYKTSLRNGKYLELRRGFPLVVGVDSKIENWGIDGRSYYFFVGDNSIAQQGDAPKPAPPAR